MKQIVYLNSKIFDEERSCKFCLRVFEFTEMLFEIEDLKSLVPQKYFSTDSLMYVVELNGDVENIVSYARTPNEVRNLLRDFNVISIPEEFLNADLTTLFVKLSGGTGVFRKTKEPEQDLEKIGKKMIEFTKIPGFLKGSKVLMSNGYSNIEDVKPGDAVTSYSIETNSFTTSEVEEVVVYNSLDFYSKTEFPASLYELHYEINGEREVLFSSSGQLFLSPEISDFKKPTGFAVGESFLSLTGPTKILGITDLKTTEFTSYCLRLKGLQTYVVNGVIVLKVS